MVLIFLQNGLNKNRSRFMATYFQFKYIIFYTLLSALYYLSFIFFAVATTSSPS